MRKLHLRLASLAVVVALVPAVSFAHPGRTDSNGGHTDSKTGEYHYHNSGTASTPAPVYSTPAPTQQPIVVSTPVPTPTPTPTPAPPKSSGYTPVVVSSSESTDNVTFQEVFDEAPASTSSPVPSSAVKSVKLPSSALKSSGSSTDTHWEMTNKQFVEGYNYWADDSLKITKYKTASDFACKLTDTVKVQVFDNASGYVRKISVKYTIANWDEYVAGDAVNQGIASAYAIKVFIGDDVERGMLIGEKLGITNPESFSKMQRLSYSVGGTTYKYIYSPDTTPAHYELVITPAPVAKAGTVYIVTSGNGKKFHGPSCATTNGHETKALSRSEAESKGYTACKICKP